MTKQFATGLTSAFITRLREQCLHPSVVAGLKERLDVY